MSLKEYLKIHNDCMLDEDDSCIDDDCPMGGHFPCATNCVCGKEDDCICPCIYCLEEGKIKK